MRGFARLIGALNLATLLFALEGTAAQLDRWEVVMPPSPYRHLFDVTYRAGLFVAVGETSTSADWHSEIFTSVNGRDWTRRHSVPNGVLNGATYGAGRFIAVGGASSSGDIIDLIVSSPDGTNWTRTPSSIPRHLFAVHHAEGRFVAAGAPGALMSSLDGIVWTDHSFQNEDYLMGVAYGAGRFVVIGFDYLTYGGVSITSTNGVNWERRRLGVAALRDITYGNGQFVVVRDNDGILRSTNGLVWTPSSAGMNAMLAEVTFEEGTYIAVGYYGRIASSTNGLNWVLHRQGTESFTGLAYGNGSYVTIDYFGGIWRAGPPNRPPTAVVNVLSASEFFSVPPKYVVISPNGIDAEVILSADGSFDPDGEGLSFLWLKHELDGTDVELAQTQDNTVILSVGQHRLTLRVRDQESEGAQAFEVSVITVSEAIDGVAALIDISAVDRNDKAVLLAMLRSAQHAFEGDRIIKGLRWLAEVQAYVNERLTYADPSMVRWLIGALDDIRASLEP